jgi:hypothetical protein
MFIENPPDPFRPIFILTDNYLESVQIRLETILVQVSLFPCAFALSCSTSSPGYCIDVASTYRHTSRQLQSALNNQGFVKSLVRSVRQKHLSIEIGFNEDQYHN